MRIQENVKVEIQHALGHDFPDASDPGFPAFYSQLEIEHPELASKLVGSIVEDAPEEPLFPEQLLQAKTRGQARGFMRSAFYRKDPYTGEWNLSKGKVGLAGIAGVCLLIFPMLFLTPGGSSRPAPVAAAPTIKKPDPAPVIDAPPQPKLAVKPKPIQAAPTVTNTFPPAPEAYPVPAPAAPSYVAAPAPRYQEFTPRPAPQAPTAEAIARKKPAGSVYQNARPVGGIVLYSRENPQTTVRGAQLAAASQQAARSSGQALTSVEASSGRSSNGLASASEAQFATASAVTIPLSQGNQPGAAESSAGKQGATADSGITLFQRGQASGSAQAGNGTGPENLTTDTLAPGMIIPASLATGIAIAEGGQPVPVIARTDTGLTFIGTATLNAARRMEIQFKEVVMAGSNNTISAQAFAPDGLPGLVVDVKDVAPSLVPDLLRASASGVTNYVKSLSEATTTTIVPFGGATSSRSSVPLGSSIAGAIADLFSVPPTQKALVRIAQVDRGTPVLVTIIGGSQAAKP